MKIFSSGDNVFNAVDLIIENGFVVVGGTKSIAVPNCERIIHALEPYEEIEPLIGYTNVGTKEYFYFVYDNKKFKSDDIELKRKVQSTIK